MLTLGAIVLAVAAVAALDALVGTLRLGWLRDEPPVNPSTAPPVSVIVAARNEADHIAPALASVLAQDYPTLEVIVVDDRSEDGTGRILDEIANAERRLEVLHVQDLPDGWLGKNHALHAGAAAASGDWLLFTDADVVFEPSALARAVGAAMRRGLDMLAVAPRIDSPSWTVRAFVAGFAVFFSLYSRPWRVRDPQSSASVGIGAFNLVRTTAYRRAGGHAPIRLRPDDDLMLGRLIKRRGGRCDMVFGDRLLRVAWYPSFRALVHGLMKNAFAGVGYRVAGTILSVAALLAVGAAPLVLTLAASGPLRGFAGVVYVLQTIASVVVARSAGLPLLYGLGLPVSSLVFSWILVRATALTVYHGGISWRGTFYRLDDLRSNRF